MTVRDDFVIDFLESPRIIEIAEPSTEITMQDLVDTLRKQEDAFSKGLPHEKLIDASGKQDLGSGVLVGITADLQNAQLSFEPRRTASAVGSVTTGSGTPVGSPLGPTYNFVDTGADFVSAGIERGSLAINFTDMSVADVIEVVSSTELRTRVLVNGTGNTWDVSDNYQIFNIIQCNASGGNLVAANENGDRITSVFPTAFVQVVRTASSSATLQEQADIQYASFGGGVTVDISGGIPGTIFPIGTPREPVNNMADASSILLDRGFDSFYIIGDATIAAGTYPNRFVGQAVSISTITLDPVADLLNARFENATITGTLDGDAALTNCNIQTLNLFNGTVNSCVLSGTITLGGSVDALILDSFSDVGGCTIDMGGSGQALDLLNFHGEVTLTNKTGAEEVAVGLSSGQVTVDDSVDNGTINLFGVGKWVNEATYAGNATIVNELIAAADSQLVTFNERICVDVINGTSGTAYPTGTARQPVDNLTDAATIATARSLHHIMFMGDGTIGTEADWTGFIFEGENSAKSTLTFLAGATTTEIEVFNAQVTGTITGSNIEIRDSTISFLVMHSGQVLRCGLQGTTTFTGGNTNEIRFVDCYGAGDPAASIPKIDLGGDGPLFTMARYAGGMTLLNKTGAKAVGVIQQGGPMTIEATVTSGLVVIGGLCSLTDNSGGATVLDLTTSPNQGIIDTLNSNTYDGATFSDVVKNLLSMATGRIVESATGVFDFYEQDNSTVAFTLTKSGNERNRS